MRITSKQINNREIGFEEIKSIFQKLRIRSFNDLRNAKKEKTLQLPSMVELDNLCIKETGKPLKDFCGFVRSKTKPRTEDRLLDSNFIDEFRTWCIENKITSYLEYVRYKPRPKQFPSSATISKKYGNSYFQEVLKLERLVFKKKDKLTNEEFVNKIKAYCIENNIDSINKYRTDKNKPKEFPSHEWIRQHFGYDFFNVYIGIENNRYDSDLILDEEKAREVCHSNQVYTIMSYFEFRKEFNGSSDSKLPNNPSQYYQKTWREFINLSDTQLFISNGMSSMELLTYKLLTDRGIDFETEKIFDECKNINPLPFDFYLPGILTQPIAIELDGEQHRLTESTKRYNIEKIQKNDLIKNEFCHKVGIKLIRIDSILKIESVLNTEIHLLKYKKIKDLDWTSDFANESQVMNSQLSKSLKVKILLLLAEKKKSTLVNSEIINLTGIKKPHFYAIKNELINLGLIDRPNEYHYSEAEKENIISLFREGNNISQIVKKTGYSRRDYIVKLIKDAGINYTSSKLNEEESKKKKDEVINLYKTGKSVSEIAKKMMLSVPYTSSILTEYRVKIGKQEVDEKVIQLVQKINEMKSAGFNMAEISKQLGISTQRLYTSMKIVNASKSG